MLPDQVAPELVEQHAEQEDASPNDIVGDFEIRTVFGMTVLEWTKAKSKRSKELVVDRTDLYVGLEWRESELRDGEDKCAWQRLDDTFEDSSGVGEQLLLHLNQFDGVNQRVLVKWAGGGFDCWAPGTIDALNGNEMTVKYDPEMNARVQKVDVIDVGTLEHRREVMGSNNPSSRTVKAWILESHTDHGVLTTDGSHVVPVVGEGDNADKDRDEDSDDDSDDGSCEGNSNSSVSSVESDENDDVPLQQQANAGPSKAVSKATPKRLTHKGAPKAAPKAKAPSKRASPKGLQVRKSKRTAAQMAKIQLKAAVESEVEDLDSSDDQ